MCHQCLYLRKSYEIAVQSMNILTWEKCIKLAINELADCGIFYITSYRTVQLINIEFRKSEQITSSYERSNTEPKIFSVFPEVKNMFMELCNKKVIDGSLSIELACCEMRDNISKHCYEVMLKEDALKDHQSYDEFKIKQGFNKLSCLSTWRWLTRLGFKYDTNKRVITQMDMIVKMWLRIEIEDF